MGEGERDCEVLVIVKTHTRRMNSHRKLLAWQACRELIREVYRVTGSFPLEERFGLTSQLRRSAVSAASNIAEGYARSGLRETAHGLSIAVGSLAETDTLLAVAEDQEFLSPAQLDTLNRLLVRASQLTHGFLRKLRKNAR
jgi:four helix bundle protein